MRVAADRSALAAAMALCAALAAVSPAAWADGAAAPPFTGAGTEGRQPPVEKSAAGTVAQASSAGDASSGAAGNAAPDDGGTALGSGAEAGAPVGGSRLLRALAELQDDAPSAAATEATGAAPLPGARVFAAEACPRALLRRLLAGAVDGADALSVLGIEREVLTLCRERQEIVAGLFEAEALLRELRAPEPAPAAAQEAAATFVPETLVPETEKPAERNVPAPAVQAVSPSQRAAPSPLRAALAAAEDDAIEAEAQARVSPARVSPRYAWFSIIGTAGALRAGITDGVQVWFVREGDALPGGARIAAISGRPPGVRIGGADGTLGPESGDATALPFAGTSVYETSVRARPGEAL